MNKLRKEDIKKIINELDKIKLKLSTICDKEVECFENMPENLQGSSRGCDSEEAIEYMEEAKDLIEDAIDKLEDI